MLRNREERGQLLLERSRKREKRVEKKAAFDKEEGEKESVSEKNQRRQHKNTPSYIVEVFLGSIYFTE